MKPVVVLLGCLWVWMWTTLTIEVKPVVVFAGLSVGLDVENTDEAPPGKEHLLSQCLLYLPHTYLLP